MKRKFGQVCVILIAALYVVCGITACNNDEHGKITSEYAKLYNIHKSEVSFKCYGEFEDTHVIMFGGLYAQALSSEMVDGVIFHHSELKTFTVYNNGNFYSLQEAFNSGLLNHDNLLTVQENYNPK